MIPDATPTTFGMLILGVSSFILIMLLPAILELKKPRDAGPRRIMDDSAMSQIGIALSSLEPKEEKIELDLAILKKLVDVIAVLPNLEA
jgi:hypothetical protein